MKLQVLRSGDYCDGSLLSLVTSAGRFWGRLDVRAHAAAEQGRKQHGGTLSRGPQLALRRRRRGASVFLSWSCFSHVSVAFATKGSLG